MNYLSKTTHTSHTDERIDARRKKRKYAMKEYINHYVKYKRKQTTTVQDIDYMKTTTRNENFKQRQKKIQLTTSTIMKTY